MHFAAASFSRFAYLNSSDAQTIYIYSPELTSILIPSCRLRIPALLSSGCRATAESLSSVHSSSTVAEFTSGLNANCTCRDGKHFHFR